MLLQSQEFTTDLHTNGIHTGKHYCLLKGYKFHCALKIEKGWKFRQFQ